MNLKSTFALAAAIATGLALSACSVVQDVGNTTHENQSTSILLDAPVEKVPDAIQKGAAKAGYTVKKVKETSIDGEYQAEGLDITYKKMDDAKTKMFVRAGAFGEKDKESLVINEVQKSLGLKK